MTNEMFKKEAFKKSVKDNVKFLYRKTIEEATQEQIFQAVSYTVKDVIIDNWLATQKAYDEQDPKIVYYMSMEFLMGLYRRSGTGSGTWKRWSGKTGCMLP